MMNVYRRYSGVDVRTACHYYRQQKRAGYNKQSGFLFHCLTTSWAAFFSGSWPAKSDFCEVF
jgi:hypothetical protein